MSAEVAEGIIWGILAAVYLVGLVVILGMRR